MAALGGVITGLRERASALAVGLSLATVTLATGFISYTHISALTVDYWQNWKTAHLMPLAVDGQIVIGSVYFMEHSGEKRRWLGLIGVVPGILESLYSNWQSVAPPPGVYWLTSLEAHFWATVPAQAFACSTILFERWVHSRRQSQGKPGILASLTALTTALAPEEVIKQLLPQAPEPAAPGPEPEGAPRGLVSPAAAPEAAPLALPYPLPLPVMGPASQPPARRPRPKAVPAEGDARLPLPADEGELRKIVSSMTRNKIWETYQVSKGGADKLRAQYLDSDSSEEVA